MPQPATKVTTYALQPVNAGVSTGEAPGGVALVPLGIGLALLCLSVLWLAVTGRMPRLTRLTQPRDRG
jgi:hypothetical protein